MLRNAFLSMFLVLAAFIPGIAAAVDLGTYTIDGVPANQPPAGYDGEVITLRLLPRDQGGVVAARPNANYPCAWSKAQVQIQGGWGRVVVALDRTGWSAPPSTTTCSATVNGTFYSLNLVINTMTIDYTNRITDYSAGLNLALGSIPTYAGSWSVLPNAGAYVEETTFALKNGSTYDDIKCRVAQGTGGNPSRYWLRVEVNATGSCTAAQNCVCRYKLVGGSYQSTPVVITR